MTNRRDMLSPRATKWRIARAKEAASWAGLARSTRWRARGTKFAVIGSVNSSLRALQIAPTNLPGPRHRRDAVEITQMNQRDDALTRRSLMGKAAGAGAFAAAVQLLPPARVMSVDPQPAPTPIAATGYRLSEHVKRYYRTTLV